MPDHNEINICDFRTFYAAWPSGFGWSYIHDSSAVYLGARFRNVHLCSVSAGVIFERFRDNDRCPVTLTPITWIRKVKSFFLSLDSSLPRCCSLITHILRSFRPTSKFISRSFLVGIIL